MADMIHIPHQTTDLDGPLGRAGDHPVAVYLAGLTKDSSRRVMFSALATIAQYLAGETPDPARSRDSDYQQHRADLVKATAWGDIQFKHVRLIRSKLAEDYAPSTANRYLAALRGVLKACRKLRYIDAESLADMLDESKAVRGGRVPKGRSLTGGEIYALLHNCALDASPAGARDAAIIAVLYTCGLRRSELVALDRGDFQPTDGALTVMGKGNKQRTVYLVNEARAALDDWLTVRGDHAGPIFHPIRRGGHIKPRRLTSQAVLHILAARADSAGVADFSPHDLRRTVAGDLLDAGADIVTVQKLLGHSDVQTTARYDRRGEASKRAAQTLIGLPYLPRG